MPKTTSRGAPALLTMPYYRGTLAAVRCLGRRGVDVVVASDKVLTAGSWSRHVTRRVKCMSADAGPVAVKNWLLGFGRASEGAVLYPTSDNMAWVISRYREELRQHFHLFAPPIAAVASLLDKSVLHELCRELGIATPTTWCLRSEGEIADIWRAGQTLLVKPRSQLFCPKGGKGETVANLVQAQRSWRQHCLVKNAPGIREELADINLPLVQEYKPAGANGTYSISGFIDAYGRVLSARASTKVLQSPPTVGIGICFVAAEVDARALSQIAALSKRVGFFGTFEVEFVRDGQELLLIDFNPRYYGQMGFDIARGAELPWLVQQAALGSSNGLDSQLQETPPADAPTVYYDRVTLGWRMGIGLVSGSVSWGEVEDWRRFMREANGRGLDGSWRLDDPLPSVVAAAAIAWESVRHPRAFATSMRHGVGLRKKDQG